MCKHEYRGCRIFKLILKGPVSEFGTCRSHHSVAALIYGASEAVARQLAAYREQIVVYSCPVELILKTEAQVTGIGVSDQRNLNAFLAVTA